MTRNAATSRLNRLSVPLALAAACGLALAAPAAAQLIEPFPAVFEVETLLAAQGGDGSLGVVLNADGRDAVGWAVASAGDVIGDGTDDVIIGGPVADRVYVVFGRGDGDFPAEMSLALLDGTNGFRIRGEGGRAGASIAPAGDVNGDGIGDMIVGACSASPGGRTRAGAVYIVFGAAGGFPAELDLSTLDGSNGFRIEGIEAGDQAGYSVASAGDMNGDGVDDVVMGAPYAGSGEEPSGAGASCVLFGRRGVFSATMSLTELDGTNGFRDFFDFLCFQNAFAAGRP